MRSTTTLATLAALLTLAGCSAVLDTDAHGKDCASFSDCGDGMFCDAGSCREGDPCGGRCASGWGCLPVGSDGLCSNFGWGTSFGGAKTEWLNGLIADKSGDNLFVGVTFGSPDVVVDSGKAGAVTVANADPGGSSEDLLIAKFNGTTGEVIEARGFGGSARDEVWDIAGTRPGAAAQDTLFITGSTLSDDLDFGQGVLADSNGTDIFLAELDPQTLVPVWSLAIGGDSGDDGNAVAVDAHFQVVLLGTTRSTMVNAGGDPLNARGDTDILVAAYDYVHDGVHAWSRRIGGTGYDIGEDVACGDDFTQPHSPCYITGSLGGSGVDLGNGPLPVGGVFLARLSGADGSAVWSQSFGGESGQSEVVAVDATGNVLLAGSFGGPTINLGGDDLVNANEFAEDIFVAKYDADGNHLWSARFGGHLDDRPLALDADAEGNVYLGGQFLSDGGIDFGGGTIAYQETGAVDASNAFVVKLDPQGKHLWSRGAKANGRGLAVARSESETKAVFFGGSIEAPEADFGDPGNPVKNGNSGSKDGFVVRLAP